MTTSGRRKRPTRRPWAFAAAAIGATLALAWYERRRALRRRRNPTPARIATNLALAGLTAAATHVAMAPVVNPLARWVTRRRIGLTQQLPLPEWARDTIAVLLLDYTLYLWHVAEHKIPAFYRFHQVHHADLDLDVSTAARFHFGEFLLSVPWRAAQIALIGVSPRALSTWQRLTALSVLFHHSNVRLPLRVERWAARLVMTPRLHGIHHSIVAEEQSSNWSSGLVVWDLIHRTYRANVRQSKIVIGVPALRTPREVGLPESVTLRSGQCRPGGFRMVACHVAGVRHRRTLACFRSFETSLTVRPMTAPPTRQHYFDAADLGRFPEISRGNKDLADKFFSWYNAVFAPGALTAREKSLIALAVAHTVQCPYCIDAYSKDALEKGSNVDEMTEAVHVAAAIRGGSSLVHGVQMLNHTDNHGM
jgi:alkylhydroperoxidase/carboxymuconolactone decarboxylase family protein